jgi:hypothetical protein
MLQPKKAEMTKEERQRAEKILDQYLQVYPFQHLSKEDAINAMAEFTETPTKEEIEAEADLYYSKEIFILACEWYHNHMTKTEK